MRHATFLLAVVFLLASTLGCSGGSRLPPPSSLGTVVVGVTSELRVGVDIDKLHVVMQVNGAVTSDQVLLSSATGPSELRLPAEFPFAGLADGDEIAIEIDVYHDQSEAVPIATRLASTRIVAGKDLLLALSIDTRCLVVPGSSAPACTAPETCVAGVCNASFVDPSTLPAYTPGWSGDGSDICKPIGGGPPVVTIGEGQDDYLPLTDGEVDQVEAGPQGGHHVWVAIRQKGIHQSGTVTELTGEIPELGLSIMPFTVIFTFDQDEGGYCKLYGLRFQLDQQVEIQKLLGHTLQITATLTDRDGTKGIAHRTVQLSNNFI
jgi:hypothetical protein